MKKLIFGLLLLSACDYEPPVYKYTIKTVSDGWNTYYYTDSINLNNGCVEFKEHNSNPRVVCGTFTIE